MIYNIELFIIFFQQTPVGVTVFDGITALDSDTDRNARIEFDLVPGDNSQV